MSGLNGRQVSKSNGSAYTNLGSKVHPSDPKRSKHAASVTLVRLDGTKDMFTQGLHEDYISTMMQHHADSIVPALIPHIHASNQH